MRTLTADPPSEPAATVVNDLLGRTVLVTGANRGIGAGFVEAALARGATRVIAAARDVASLDAARREHGDRLVPLRLDVTDPAAGDIVTSLEHRVDLLVSNAGIGSVGGVLSEVDVEDYRRLFEVNVIGPIRLFRALAPQLVQAHGGILAVVSCAALGLSRSSPVYSGSKAAALMSVMGLREELRSSGVTVTASLPGFVATDLVAASDMPKATPREVADRSLDGHLAGTPTVFPDLYAELVQEVLCSDPMSLLDNPGVVMNEIVARRRALAAR